MSSRSSFSLLSSLLILSLLPLLSSARPCKTLFISYYSITTTTSAAASTASLAASTASLAAASSSDHRHHPTYSRFDAVYRIIPLFPRHRPVHLDRPARPQPAAALGISPSSLQDRAKDIPIVVAGLLFGLGCGAITASTMYLVWSLLTNNHHQICAGYDDESDDDVETAKKMGYVKIAAADPVPAVAKEGYEGRK